MRAIFIILVLVLAPLHAMADPDVGCGVGTQVMEGNKGRVSKLAASCINGLTFQSVSITFGLLNCTNVDGAVTADASEMKLRHYASQNFDRLLDDMARGQGENIEALAYLLEIPEADHGAFGRLTQSNFAELFPHPQVTVGEMLNSLDRLMAEDDQFATYARS
jgi:hypothetical protein